MKMIDWLIEGCITAFAVCMVMVFWGAFFHGFTFTITINDFKEALPEAIMVTFCCAAMLARLFINRN